MARKFKVGDIVKVVRVGRNYPPKKYFQKHGRLGKITKIDLVGAWGFYPYCIQGLTRARRKRERFATNELALVRRAK